MPQARGCWGQPHPSACSENGGQGSPKEMGALLPEGEADAEAVSPLHLSAARSCSHLRGARAWPAPPSTARGPPPRLWSVCQQPRAARWGCGGGCELCSCRLPGQRGGWLVRPGLRPRPPGLTGRPRGKQDLGRASQGPETRDQAKLLSS